MVITSVGTIIWNREVEKSELFGVAESEKLCLYSNAKNDSFNFFSFFSKLNFPLILFINLKLAIKLKSIDQAPQVYVYISKQSSPPPNF